METTVYKLGGSLLTLPDLPRRIRHVLAQRRNSRPLLVVGGGEVADIVRRWDRLHHLGQESAHWLALRSMMLGETLLEHLLPEARLVGTRASAERAWRDAKLPILCAHDFLRTEETRAGSRLPHNWDATSDSVAAWIAIQWPAEEFVFLKSAPRPGIAGRVVGPGQVSPQGAVDAYFPELRPQLPRIGWVNLRGDNLQIESWPHGSPI